MKYSMVKQFSNSAIDNAYTFVFKIVDFGKLLYETFWGFLEIWIAFFLIFYNMFMYVYYFFLFALDRGVESNVSMYFSRKIPKRFSRAPSVSVSSAPNPIPAMYGGRKMSGSMPSAAPSAPAPLTSLRTAPSGSGAKRNFLKSFLEFFPNFFSGLWSLILAPVKAFLDFFETKMKPVREEEAESTSKSLIDEYMKEYERKKNR
ncbi:MAG TPA: hypothetical protein PK926_06000 [Spirochaetota bacterium]|nr:hypothetical protein [Spirochaetota bacterium]HPI87684.1 hypothetical protein [Spirochaetota bacterium]HPR49704.1 hypothetical protein [Spirochaetota bacterium]